MVCWGWNHSAGSDPSSWRPPGDLVGVQHGYVHFFGEGKKGHKNLVVSTHLENISYNMIVKLDHETLRFGVKIKSMFETTTSKYYQWIHQDAQLGDMTNGRTIISRHPNGISVFRLSKDLTGHEVQFILAILSKIHILRQHKKKMDTLLLKDGTSWLWLTLCLLGWKVFDI